MFLNFPPILELICAQALNLGTICFIPQTAGKLEWKKENMFIKLKYYS